jgi:flagellin
MSIVVNTNVSSILVQRSLANSTGSIGKSLERLSTGSKINSAADDAAGLVISEGLKSQERGSATAAQNAQTGANLLQSAEGDLGVIQENLQRVRDLSVQAANGTYGSTERNAIKSEVKARLEEIDRIAKASKFSKINLLDGTKTDLKIQIGADSTASLNALTVGAPLKSATMTGLSITTSSQTLSSVLDDMFASSTKAASFVSTIDTAISEVSTRRSDIGSLQNRLSSAIASLGIKQENMAAANSRIRDVDVAKEAAVLTKNQILQQASVSLLAQANQSPSIALSLI